MRNFFCSDRRVEHTALHNFSLLTYEKSVVHPPHSLSEFFLFRTQHPSSSSFLWPLFISPAHISYHPLQILTRARYSYEGSWLLAPAGGNSSVNWKYPRARSLVILYTKPLPTGPEICALDQQICEKDISGSLEIKHADYATS